MTLEEMSKQYEESAELLRKRIKELRAQLKAATDSDDIWHLKRRIAELSPMLTQMNELAELTQKYYHNGYYVSKKYSTINTQFGSLSQKARDDRRAEWSDQIGDTPEIETPLNLADYRGYKATK